MTPRTKEQNEAIRRQRIFQIQNTAAEIFLEKGVNLEMGDIARRAGLGRGTVYHYYDNKMSLLGELMHQAYEEARMITEQTICVNQCPLLRLEYFAAAQIKQWIERPYLFILFKYIFQPEPILFENYEKLRSNFYMHIYSPVLDTIRKGVHTKKIVPIEPEIISQFYFGTLIGAVSGYFGKKVNNEFIDSEWRDGVIKLLVRGMER